MKHAVWRMDLAIILTRWIAFAMVLFMRPSAYAFVKDYADASGSATIQKDSGVYLGEKADPTIVRSFENIAKHSNKALQGKKISQTPGTIASTASGPIAHLSIVQIDADPAEGAWINLNNMSPAGEDDSFDIKVVTGNDLTGMLENESLGLLAGFTDAGGHITNIVSTQALYPVANEPRAFLLKVPACVNTTVTNVKLAIYNTSYPLESTISNIATVNAFECVNVPLPHIVSVPVVDLNAMVPDADGMYTFAVTTNMDFTKPLQSVQLLTQVTSPNFIDYAVYPNITLGQTAQDKNILYAHLGPLYAMNGNNQMLGNFVLFSNYTGLSNPEEFSLVLLDAPVEDPGPPLESGDVVSVFELDTPASNDFLLRGTMPIPAGVYPRADGKQPFAIKDSDGTLVRAQIETVTRHANGDARVVQLFAPVHTPSNAGSRITYEVVLSPNDPISNSTQTSTIDFLKGVQNLPSYVKNELLNPGAMTMHTQDVHGNQYSCDLLTGPAKIMRGVNGGDYSRTVRTRCVLTPEVPGNGAYGHSLGITAFLTAMTGQDFLSVDMRFANDSDGLDAGNPANEAHDEEYWKMMELTVPQEASVVPTIHDVAFQSGGITQSPNKITYAIVKALPNGQYNYSERGDQFIRRLAIGHNTNENDMRHFLDKEGVGFVRDDAGLWNWFNIKGYYFEGVALPRFSQSKASIRAELAQSFNTLKGQVESGANVLHHKEPYYDQSGGTYQGTTGGNGVEIVNGEDVAYSGSREGLMDIEFRHRAIVGRMFVHLRNSDGSHIDLAQLKKSTATCAAWQDAQFNPSTLSIWAEKLLGIDGNNPFGYDNPALQEHAQYAQSHGLDPFYKAALGAYMTIDHQHRVRFYRTLWPAVLLENDMLARDDMEQDAHLDEIAQTFLPRQKMWGNYACQDIIGSLKVMKDAVAANPGTSVPELGRGQAWPMHNFCAVYSMGDDAYRASKKYYLDAFTDMLQNGQTDYGVFASKKADDWCDQDLYRCSRDNERTFVSSALNCIRENVYEGVDPSKAEAIDDMLIKDYANQIHPTNWDESKNLPYTVVPVANTGYTVVFDPDSASFPYAALGESSAQGSETGHSLGKAFAMTNDDIYLLKMQAIMGMNDATLDLETLAARLEEEYSAHKGSNGSFYLAPLKDVQKLLE